MVGDGSFDVGSGKLSVEYPVAPKEGELEINAGSGDVEILFPPGVKMQSKVRAGSGEVFKEIEDSADAVFRLKINAGSGDVRVKKNIAKD